MLFCVLLVALFSWFIDLHELLFEEFWICGLLFKLLLILINGDSGPWADALPNRSLALCKLVFFFLVSLSCSLFVGVSWLSWFNVLRKLFFLIEWNTQHFKTFIVKIVICLHKVRIFLATRTTPRSPKIYQYIFTFNVAATYGPLVVCYIWRHWCDSIL